MTSVEEAASVGLPNLLRSDRPDTEARSFLFGFNLLAWRSPRSYSLNQIRRRWKYLALALGRRDMVARITEITIDGPAGPIRMRLYSPEGGRALRPALVGFSAFCGPAEGALHRLDMVLARGDARRAFVERHDDVGAEPDLRLHRRFRPEELPRTVQVRAKLHPIF